ncbi:AAA family ATPase [Shewanella sp. WXL01]|uniref:AAA family ATPase n=1 Tax=Shewanella sp. WXL01 TaxID=2709721 RepID=UPI0014385ABD|nr:AAA family ATPase [Shewanella sp. WXL01]NKF51335.1 AAA family ATPase [Shewanella sp. WXL01]
MLQQTSDKRLHVKPVSWHIENKREFKPLLEGWISEGETMLFYGASGSGKSLFAYNFAVAIAGDKSEWLEQPCATGVKTLYVDGEMATNTVAQRGEALGHHDNIAYCSVPCMDGTFNLSKQEDRELIYAEVRENDHQLVIIDNCRTLFAMADENSAESWTPVNELALHLRQLGCAVIVIHHTNKSGEYSGSSNAITVFDRTCCIEKNGSETDTHQQYWNLSAGIKSGRDGKGWGRWLANGCFVIGEDGLEMMDFSKAKHEQLNAIYQQLSGLDKAAPTKARISIVNDTLAAGIGNNRTLSNLWEHTKNWWAFFEDELHITDKKSMAAWLNSPVLPDLDEQGNFIPLTNPNSVFDAQPVFQH